jgi:uncharacterized protein (DUF433 family)
MIAFENKPEIGKGIYTLRDVASILKMPYPTVRRWVRTYWDGKLGEKYQQRYSWERDGSVAVSFRTVVELYVMIRFAEKGVKTQDVLIAHQELSDLLQTPFPFAQKEVLDKVETDGKTVFWKIDGVLVSMNGTRQINLDSIQVFFKKLEFEGDVVSRLWPMGKECSIVIDPKRKFGHPILDGRNIYPETLHGYYKAGESIPFIAYIFEITEKEVKDAIDFCEAA